MLITLFVLAISVLGLLNIFLFILIVCSLLNVDVSLLIFCVTIRFNYTNSIIRPQSFGRLRLYLF